MAIRVDGAQVRALDGELHRELVGQTVRIVVRDTTTAFPIQNGAGDPIAGSDVAVLGTYELARFWFVSEDPSDLYLDWLDVASGARGPVNFDVVLRDAAAASATSSDASATSSAASAASAAAAEASVAALGGWVEKGVTSQNVILDPRATDGAKWSAVSAPSTELMVTGATDGPTLPNGSKVTTYARFTMTADVGSVATSFGYQIPNEDVGAWPSGTRLAAGIYIRSSVALPASYPAVSQQMPGTPWTESAAQRLSSVQTAIPANTWVRLADTFLSTADAGAFGARAFLQAASSVLLVNGAVVEVTAALSAPGATTVPDHFDGDTPSTSLVGYGWEGTANASVSRRIDMRLVRAIKVSGGATLFPDVSGTIDLSSVGGGGTMNHSALSGLSNDDHPQYLTQARADSRYYTKAQVVDLVNAAVAASSVEDRKRANHTGTQNMASIDLLSSALAVRDISIDVVTGLEERPSGSNRVRWVGGSTQPVNMIGGDVWESRTGSTPGDTTPPSAPASVSTSGVAATSLTLSWTAATDNIAVTGYRVRRNGVLLPSLYTGTSALMTGLAASTAYVFEVAAQDANENLSTFTAAPEVTTGASSDTEDPSVPENLVASSITAAGFIVTCDEATDNVGVTGYRWLLDGVEYDISEGPSQIFTGRAAGVEYDVTVQAMDEAGNTSDPSAILPVTTSAGGSLPTHSVLSTPPGALAKTTEASPYEHATGFYTYTSGANGWKVKGARLYIPSGISVPTSCEVNLYVPAVGAAPELGTPTKTVTMTGITANAWNTVNFPSVTEVTPGVGCFYIGIKFADGTWLGVTAFGEAFVAAADGSTLVLADRDPFAGQVRNYRRVGTGSTTPLTGAERDAWFGMDVIVEED